MFFETAGVGINYQRGGSGAPVLLLHGWGGCADSMRPFFDMLKLHRTVYAVDFPGHGKSSMPKRPWTVGDFADATLAFIHAMDIMGCDVIAHSFGARIVIKLASGNKDIFSRIVLTGAAGVRKRRNLGYYMRIYRYKLAKKLSKSRFMCGFLQLLHMDIKERVQNAGSVDYRALPENMRRTFSLVVKENLRPLLRRIQNPTLLMWGEGDMETPLWMAKAMEKEIPDCGLVTYPNVGHFAYLERKNEFAAVIAQFLLNGRSQ